MDLEHYEIEKLDERTYRFFSTGSKGRFEMRVKFTYIWQNINKVLPLLSDYTVAGYKSKGSRYEHTSGTAFGRQGQWCEIETGVGYDAFLIYKE